MFLPTTALFLGNRIPICSSMYSANSERQERSYFWKPSTLWTKNKVLSPVRVARSLANSHKSQVRPVGSMPIACQRVSCAKTEVVMDMGLDVLGSESPQARDHPEYGKDRRHLKWYFKAKRIANTRVQLRVSIGSSSPKDKQSHSDRPWLYPPDGLWS